MTSKKRESLFMSLPRFRISLIFVACVGMVVLWGDALGLYSSAGLLRWASVVVIVFTICMYGPLGRHPRVSETQGSALPSTYVVGKPNEHVGVPVSRLTRVQRSPWTQQASLAMTLFAAIFWARGSYVLDRVPDWVVLLTWAMCIIGPVGLWWTSPPKGGRPTEA